jgi:hypothetical protein
MGPEIPKGSARAASSTLMPVFRTMKALVFANARVRTIEALILILCFKGQLCKPIRNTSG